MVGNVYKGRVSKVLPGMQSSFVDLGLERDGFLYVSDVITPAEALEDERRRALDACRRRAAVEPADATAVERRRRGARPTGDGAGRRGPGDGDRADGRRAGAADAEAGGRRPPAAAGARRPQPNIEDLLKEGQDVLVQVVKEPIGTKGARITSHVTIPGRFLVFMPTVDHIGVSRKIESREERARLRGIVRQFREAARLHRRGDHPHRRGQPPRRRHPRRPRVLPPGLEGDQAQVGRRSARPRSIYREQSLVAKLLRDLLTDEFSVIRIDSAEEHRRVTALVERIMPAMLPRVKLYTSDYPIFEEYGVRTEIDKALRSKVWLKSGGYIVINQTEALVAIDVNTGRYVGKKTTGGSRTRSSRRTSRR